MRLHDIVSGEFSDKEEAAHKPSRRGKAYLEYVRVSTDMQYSTGASIPEQKRGDKAFADQMEIVILETFEEAESAFDERHRPQFERMMERVLDDPNITGVLVHESSRFCRDPYLAPLLKGLLRSHGKELLCATEPEYDVDTPTGMMLDKLTEMKNASYSMDVAFHTRKGMRQNIQRRDEETGYCYKNGGSPIWGYRASYVERGIGKKGQPNLKTLWLKDDTVVSGRTVWEWCRHVLIEMRLGQRASLDSIRDFLNDHEIPAPRKQYWGTSTVQALMQDHVLLQYAGIATWNVRGKTGKGPRRRPPSEWEVVPNAHPAIITIEEADAIKQINEQHTNAATERSSGRMATVRTQNSPYLLTGGLMMCERCGANMVGYPNRGRLYYVCGSRPYRKGLGCGESLQVRKEEIEDAVIAEVHRLFDCWADSETLMETVNEKLRAKYQRRVVESAELERQLDEIDKQLENVRKAIKGGLDDIPWANGEIRRLTAEREEVAIRQASLGEEIRIPQLDLAQVEDYRRRFAQIIASGTNAERRSITRVFVKKITVDPDTGDVLIYLLALPPMANQTIKRKRTPVLPGVQIGMGAGRGFEPLTFGL